MKTIFTVFFIFFASKYALAVSSEQKENLNKHYNGLLTDGYGIVTKDDLAFDENICDVPPYDPINGMSYYWQCFPKNEIRPKYTTRVDYDPYGDSSKKITLCVLELDVRHNGELQIFGDHRGQHINYCREFIQTWKRLTKDQKIVCLNGDGGSFEEIKDIGKIKLWTWQKIKTQKSCYSYFAYACDTKGCADGHCPKQPN